MGKRKKFENVWASKTSFTEIAMKRPRNVETIAIRKMAGIITAQEISERSVRIRARIIGIKALTEPNIIAPVVLDSMRSFREIGARSKRSNDRFFFSNVIITESIEVVPNNTDIAITPGGSAGILSQELPDFMKNIPVQATGNNNPQLIFGGLR